MQKRKIFSKINKLLLFIVGGAITSILGYNLNKKYNTSEKIKILLGKKIFKK